MVSHVEMHYRHPTSLVGVFLLAANLDFPDPPPLVLLVESAEVGRPSCKDSTATLDIADRGRCIEST